MKSTDPLNPIRRAVGESVATLKEFVSPDSKPDRPENSRILRYESLEERRVLSVNGVEDPTQDIAYVTSDFDESGFGLQEDTISYLNVLVNGEARQLTPSNNRLEVLEGDRVEVIEIGFETTEMTGVFAAEGYVSKIGDLTSASLIDYNDGRFSGGDRDFPADGGNGRIGGLANEWVVESGWDRMTINLMHYDVDSTTVGARFFAQLQVNRPDFQFDTDHLDTILEQEITVGDQVTIPAKWLNTHDGIFHNYAEVDIYHGSDPASIIWAGAAVGNASVENSIEGEFLNTRVDDAFSRNWTPDAPGEYILKYYVDPEKVATETNENNNEYEIRLTVKAPAPVAVDDLLDAGDSLNVMENDLPAQAKQTVYEEDFESDVLSWTTNPYGTDTATSGIWEATDPVGTTWNGVQLQMEDAASGQQALVTGGLDNGTVGLDDVDGGVTSALSETIAVPADANSVLSFQYTFANLDNSSSDDFFRVTVLGEDSSKVVLEERGQAEDRGGKWVEFSVDISEFAGQGIQVLVEAADHANSSLIEAGIDNIKVEIPSSPMMINDFTQADHGTVSLNEDGTFNYTPDETFEGEDQFRYTLTDGENVSNVATVTVNVDRKDFVVQATASGDEDTAIGLDIATEFDQVKIAGVPADAVLNRGQFLGDGVYEIQASDLDGLTVTPAENSDVDFSLTVTPGDNGTYDTTQSETINVVVNAVVDGGDIQFSDFGIVTGKTGDMPVSGGFFDLDGSESHVITLTGLPGFVRLSAGTFDADSSTWTLDASDLNGLEITANKVSNTSGWDDYDKKNVFKAYQIEYLIESFEENGTESTFDSGTFDLFTIQKKKK